MHRISLRLVDGAADPRPAAIHVGPLKKCQYVETFKLCTAKLRHLIRGSLFNKLCRPHFNEKNSATGQSEPLFSQPAEVLEVQTFVLHVKYKFLHSRCVLAQVKAGVEAPQSNQSINVKRSLLMQSNRADEGTEFNDKISTLNTCLLSSPLLL